MSNLDLVSEDGQKLKLKRRSINCRSWIDGEPAQRLPFILLM